MKSWVVKEVYEYDWGNNNFTREYKIDSGDEVGFLHIEDDGELNITFSNSIKIRKIEEDVSEEIQKNEKPPLKSTMRKNCTTLRTTRRGTSGI
jgi:hypothetical protein